MSLSEELVAVTRKFAQQVAARRAAEFAEHRRDLAAYEAGTLSPERKLIFWSRVIDGAMAGSRERDDQAP